LPDSSESTHVPGAGGAPLAVHFATTGDAGIDLPIPEWEGLAALSRSGHRVVADPHHADLILITQVHMCADPLSLRALRGSEAWQVHRDRTFVVDSSDRPWCAFPGLYASMPSRYFRVPWQRAWGYAWVAEDRFLPLRAHEPDLLFSFVGGRHAPCREAVLRLRSPRALVDDSTGFNPYLPSTPTSDDRRAFYTETVARSKFVLCPRGRGTGSYRLQEVMAAGRVPVIISDDWVEPEGPDWGSATLRWPERAVRELPMYLASIEDRFPVMAAAAAEVYDTWFSADVAFDRMVEALQRVPRYSDFPERGLRDSWYGQIAWANARGRLGGIKQRALGAARR